MPYLILITLFIVYTFAQHFITQNNYNLSLIKSISGIRGTIGGPAGENLTPQDIVECTAAFGAWLIQKGANKKVVIGRDGRITGEMVKNLVTQTLIALGFEVIDLDYSTTPTVEMAVPEENAGAGIILTASHNPKHWNALKFLNDKGEFISKADGETLLQLLKEGAITYAEVDQIGSCIKKTGYIEKHIEAILAHPLVDAAAVKAAGYKVAVDCINSTGAISIPPLLEKLGCEYILINDEVTGDFAHNPEPLAKNLVELSETIRTQALNLGIAVDPDVDRLALVCEDGSMFGEEYTLVAVADYVLQHRKGNTVSNLSSSRALRDITQKHGGTYFASAVGEVNVVAKMKEMNAVIGGEGNGGIIVPELHYGRDALAGIALVLTYLAKSGKSLLQLKHEYPKYEMVKDKINLTPDIDLASILTKLEEQFKSEDYNTIDGLKINFADGWVHLRKSNTEPIIRVYSEAGTKERAEEFVKMMKDKVMNMIA